MKLYELIVASAIGSLLGAIATYMVGKKLIKGQKDEIFDEILEYLGSPEGQQSVRNLGTIFAQGISKGIGLGDAPLKGKTFGIQNWLIKEGIDRIFPEKGKKPISKEKQEISVNPLG